MRFTLLLSFILIISENLVAQVSLKDFTLVKSLQSKTDKTKPAIFSFTIPEDSKASYLINGAVGVDISGLFADKKTKLFKLYPFIEYNRNSLIDKEQNQLQSGLSLEWLINSNKFIPTIIGDAKYVNDYKKEVQSFQGTILFSPKFTGVSPKPKNIYYPDNLVSFGGNKLLAFEYIPYVGLENENRIMVENDSLKGNKLRFLAKIESSLYFLPVKEKAKLKFYRVVFTLNYQYRNEVINTAIQELEQPNFLQLGLNYTFYQDKNIDAKIGLDFIKGANPSEAFEEQEFYNLSLKLKM